MFKLRPHAFVFLALTAACETTDVEVPLPSVHMLRPSAGRKDLAFRLGMGIAQGPEVQGMTDVVRGPSGEEVNGVPDYRNDSEGFFSHGDYTTTPAFDLGLNFLQHFDVGWSTSRGLYAFANVLDLERFTLSVSPSYYQANQVNRDRSTSLEDGEKKFSAKVSDKSVTGLASVFFGDRETAGLSLYCGFGVHNIEVSVTDYRTGQSSSNEDTGETILFGLGLDAKSGGIFIEQAWTTLPQRTGEKPKARSFAVGGNFLFGS